MGGVKGDQPGIGLALLQRIRRLLHARLFTRRCCYRITPASGLDAVAYSFFGMRPAQIGHRPASQACCMARAIRSGSAPARSRCSAARRRSPVPSRTSRRWPCRRRRRRSPDSPDRPPSDIPGRCGCCSGSARPGPLPIGLPAGITLAAPGLLQPPGHDRVVAGVARAPESLRRPAARSLRAWRPGRAAASSCRRALRASPSRRRGCRGPSRISRPSRATRTASSAVKQPAVFGRIVYRVEVEEVEHVAALLCRSAARGGRRP